MKRQTNSRTKKILVIIDTNNLGNYLKGRIDCKNYAYLEINKRLHDNLVNNFNFKVARNVKIDIAIPEIFLEELKRQQFTAFEEDTRKLKDLLKKFSKFPKMQLAELNIDYEKYLDDKAGGYIHSYSLISIKTPTNNLLPGLINRVIQRKKPFYKRGDNDSGFKDAVAWESILEFSKSKDYDAYFFLTKDADFDDPQLFNEFRDLIGKEIAVVKEIADLKVKLEEEIKGTDEINTALAEIDANLLEILKKMIGSNQTQIRSGAQTYQVHFVHEYKITDIKSKDGGYEVYITVDFIHESGYAVYAQHGVFDQNYLEDQDISPAEITMIFDKDYNIKEISSQSLLLNGQNTLKID